MDNNNENGQDDENTNPSQTGKETPKPRLKVFSELEPPKTQIEGQVLNLLIISNVFLIAAMLALVAKVLFMGLLFLL